MTARETANKAERTMKIFADIINHFGYVVAITISTESKLFELN